MTPKEKAEELMSKYLTCTKKYKDYEGDKWTKEFESHEAKQCALIAVDEIIKSYKTNYLIADMKVAKEKKNQFTYWQEVRNEIEKL